MKTKYFFILICFALAFQVALVHASEKYKKSFCVQSLVSQFDPRLLSAYPHTPGLCTVTCLGNLLSIIGTPFSKSGPKNILKMIKFVKSSAKKSGNIYQPNTEGVDLHQSLISLVRLARKPGSKIIKIEAKSYAKFNTNVLRDLHSNPDVLTFTSEKVQPGEIINSESWMILGMVGWLGRGNYLEDSHDVLGFWDQKKKQLLVVDPANPDQPSYWKLIRGSATYPARLRKIKGPYYQDLEIVGVEEWVKILTK